MKKNLFKICIGSVAFAVFLAIGYPKLSSQNVQPQTKEKKGLISRNDSGYFTRAGNKYSKSVEKKQTSRVIYIGEPTEGLLD